MPTSVPKLEIYIKDIYLSWYVKEISKKIPNYEKLVCFLKAKMEGLTVRIVGVSSGGFIGTFLAMQLGCECISFAGQFSLKNHFDHLQVNPYLKDYAKKYVDVFEL